jgi:hypothetical protein
MEDDGTEDSEVGAMLGIGNLTPQEMVPAVQAVINIPKQHTRKIDQAARGVGFSVVYGPVPNSWLFP